MIATPVIGEHTILNLEIIYWKFLTLNLKVGNPCTTTWQNSTYLISLKRPEAPREKFQRGFWRFRTRGWGRGKPFWFCWRVSLRARRSPSLHWCRSAESCLLLVAARSPPAAPVSPIVVVLAPVNSDRNHPDCVVPSPKTLWRKPKNKQNKKLGCERKKIRFKFKEVSIWLQLCCRTRTL